MPSLLDMKQDTKKKILVVGPPGTGKTCFAASFPCPILYLDFDLKIDSAAAFYAGDEERLKGIEVRQLGKRLDGKDPIEEFLQIAKDLGEQQKSDKMQYQTLVIDSMTTFSSAVLEHIVRTNPGIKRVSSRQGVQPGMPDYGILKREFEKLIPGILSLDMNIVMTAHIKIDRSDLTGEIIRSPLMDGSFGHVLPVYFKEVWRTFMKDGKPYAQTQSDIYHSFCRSQIPKLPNPVELKYENLIKRY